MGKGIVLFVNQRPVGVFSNKKNLWMRIEETQNIADLVIPSMKTEGFVPATYSNIVNRLAQFGKVALYSMSKITEIDSATNGEDEASKPKVAPTVNIWQFEVNEVDGKVYKSSETGEADNGNQSISDATATGS